MVPDDTQRISYVLISALFPNRINPLFKGTSIILGRDKSADIYLPSNTVSRRHASIEWKEAGFYIQDLGSMNGTQVNNQLINQKLLRDNDLIIIGPFNIRYKEFKGDINTILESTDLEQETTMIGIDSMRSAVELAGKFKEMQLFEICELIEFNKKDGILIIKSKELKGKIYFLSGEIAWAETETEEGESAVFKLLSLDEGVFEFTRAVPPLSNPLNLRTSSILLDVLRIRDEKKLTKE
ncbi:MAG: FHA domain-containing protein [Deltaproteobacteria bacterium]|nr:FHA domain-containing protein [Deltaproteobacteria bacterium]